jgi:hypothetical protein
MKSIVLMILMFVTASAVVAQRPREMGQTPENKTKPAPAPAPSSIKAKYEGGVFGYNKTMEGMLTFDDANRRLLFKDRKTPKEIHIPYDAIASAFADTQKRRPAAATVVSHIPSIFALPAHFIKTKVRYLTIQYSDKDTRINGITSFKLQNKEVLASVLASLAEKTGMTQRGDIYVKKIDPTN